MSGMDSDEVRSLGLTPTWSVAAVLTVFVAVSLVVERLIHRLSSWLKKTNRNPLFEALEKMKEELMLLGFVSLLLTATSSLISNICIESKFYNGRFAPCTRSEIDDGASAKNSTLQERRLMGYLLNHASRRTLGAINHNTCKEGHEPFVSFEGLEQLHRFIFIMAITHVFYSCLTMLLAVVKIHTWRKWEDEAQMAHHDSLTEITRALTMRRQSTFVKFRTSSSWSQNRFIIWVTCFFRQFGHSVVRADYLTLRMGFISNHKLMANYDFHSYMIRSMEEEFQVIVGVSAPLWGFVVAFLLFNINGSNLYFWIAIIPITLVLLVGAKLQHVIATLALENAECFRVGFLFLVLVAVWVRFLFHPEPLACVCTPRSGLCWSVFMQLQYLATLCIGDSDGYQLQSSIDSKEDTRNNSWMEKSSEEETSTRFHNR
ncbi:MLO-like protein 14 isoform X3 [Amborella trichopoda]|uniref:MLO-like protein 14 isoform X3 n=1 Tax=Amborella trichopoda TaxID=13333 RepID=UPI0009BFDD37|nr:MLO-like protein 14 isoform X3 [Amborella trichopoda]|eukprot:XP_020525745.1 MLO-like protein 14 isoform X3 [Amborella trichopoda]